ncbi:basic-leucine zipper transcription factor f-related [Anaeramoeba flamelloides]|uniref:Basic-leucine zipper transcription factor f-related n=1 Tax=Anaeramoeba flamelloides TaxID=1746091 RepID=A0AAV7ZPF0_9EUKA|nr:basic-leucine zipper transcription factor f-related [Anaeramoeba flamelloides]
MDFQSFTNFNFENFEVFGVDSIFNETHNSLETTKTENQIELTSALSELLLPNYEFGRIKNEQTNNLIKTETFQGISNNQLMKNPSSTKEEKFQNTKTNNNTNKNTKTNTNTHTNTTTNTNSKPKKQTKKKTIKKIKKKKKSKKNKDNQQDLHPEILALRPTRKRTQLCTLDIEMSEYEKHQLRHLSKDELAKLSDKERLDRKRIRDRVSARNSRQKQKKYLDRLETKAQEILDEKNKVEEKLNILESENESLRKEILRLKSFVQSTNLNSSSIANLLQFNTDSQLNNSIKNEQYKKRRLLPNKNIKAIGIEN